MARQKSIFLRIAKKNGLGFERLKEDVNAGGKHDIFEDSAGNLFVKPKNGSRPGEPLYININDYLR